MDVAPSKAMQQDFARCTSPRFGGASKTFCWKLWHFESHLALFVPTSMVASCSTSPRVATYCKMTAMGRRTTVVLGIVGATLCFSLGWLASRVTEPARREPTATPSSEPMSGDDDGGTPGPLLLIDPSKVVLLPDASLNFEIPPPLDVPGQTNGPSR